MQIKAEEISQIIKDQIAGYKKDIDLKETGTVLSVGDGIARVYGVENCQAMELLEFPGNTFVISHDRWFLDRIATHILAFEGDSHVEFFQGNYREYEEDKKRRLGAAGAQPHRLRFKALK